MMGYEPEAVQAIYGNDLLSANQAPFAFNYQFNARLGRAPSWKEIALDEVAYPPLSDYRADPQAKPANGTK
jgi:hypothetical protein